MYKYTLAGSATGKMVEVDRRGWRCSWAVLLVVGVVVAACGGGADSGSQGPGTAPESAEAARPVANACPAEGCRIMIVDVTRSGDELAVTWEANFLPDVSKNHVHVYWDKFTAEQVSDDAQARGVEQGEWHPTDAYPTYVTQSEASVANRGDSSTICVTAGDRAHVVLDPNLFHCRDVSEHL